jgi:hypothetical protein
MTSAEYFETGLKKGRGMAQASIDLIDAMHAKAKAAQPITGRGIGTVVKVVRTQLGVLHPPSQAMPSALYATDPPVYADRHGCVVADLRPENGVVVKPGDEVHFLFVIETVAPGSWSMRTKIVYTRDGQRVEQHAPYRYNGKVANGGSSVRRDSTLEGTCKAPA